MSLAATRQLAITETIDQILGIQAAQGITRASLARIATALAALADREELFSFADFPAPAGGGADASSRYELYRQAGDGATLYLNSLNPGKNTVPHNHTTWAVIVAVRGVELNRVYARVDDGSKPEYASLALEREVSVAPGTSIQFLGDDIHSIHVQGDQPILHFHLYGRPLETLSGRIGIDPDTGKIVHYNKVHFSPSIVATA
ncbi:cysteine dioxygenase family protein [Pollutimonas bauzanensis]|uniref:Cysteine dioxygenase type I n=1 Tax=Pollutimonas bauzanensis TaxID=658167 RepID=A0A1M5NIT6_9BURK|nr:cysteine dioxygenase family protein [Pollutimonas bauzanensis]SHG89377.1 hypothetical protein SAMN04488135_101539 [Pollutimonas bauzanensis]